MPGRGIVAIDAVLVLLKLSLGEAEGEEPGPQRSPGADLVGYVLARLLLVRRQRLDLLLLPGLDLVIVRALAGLLQLCQMPGLHAWRRDLPRVLGRPFPVRNREQFGHGLANIYAVGLQLYEINLVQLGALSSPPLPPCLSLLAAPLILF